MAQNVLAVVAGHQITEEELQAFIGHLPKEQQAYASNPQFKEHCKEQEWKMQDRISWYRWY